MKIISFNINGLRARLHQLQAVIDKHQPDVIGLQEIKVHDEAFPTEAIEAMGYHVEFHGQKAHYGVALVSKQKPSFVQKGFKTDEEDAQRRMIIATYADENGQAYTVFNGYFPQGENRSHETKFPAKEKFYRDLNTELQQNYSPDQAIAIIGDVNISHTDLDIGIGEHNAKRWLKTGKCSFLPEEREWLNTLLAWGFTDSFRHLHPTTDDKYSWFDYRSKGFPDNRGLRIDLIMTTQSLTDRAIESDVDYELRGIEKPSDHAPIWTTFKA
ncbi:exodeoxyribonuclease III [Catenovulum maritimum]|uniref:Exodeoxyribonuclease III n=1 Tax=Catenovulum maritimum TaxID=1513271 RepID=A0A0J8GQQ4_9ALTE|nr:exodeoxyribonuclease III [Catenovulum maritimum]KMT65130.1 exodeoxyribonuclease III [Catenovulum maritimum]